MIIHDDLKELLRLLNDHGVDYLIVGGYAVAFHGFVRATKDIDILFRNTVENIDRLSSALIAFGIPANNMDQNTFSAEGRIVRIGVPPAMIEFINAIGGIQFEQAWRNKVSGTYGGVSIHFLSRADLLTSIRAAGHPQDLLDIRVHGTADGGYYDRRMNGYSGGEKAFRISNRQSAMHETTTMPFRPTAIDLNAISHAHVSTG
jgi:hypothetical protein